MKKQRAIVIGAGVGGLTAALDLAARDVDVLVLERAADVGGKMRTLTVAGHAIDAGPTVLTMKPVFEALFADAGASFDAEVTTHRCEVLARHAWDGGASLDLYADLDRTTDAIAAFAGAAEATRFRAFTERSRRMLHDLDTPFLRTARPSVAGLVRHFGLGRLHQLAAISPFTTLWRALGEHFHDARLRQLFGRYATYCGSSPFLAPATLMLIAHVEREGVWRVEGGMHSVARALARVAARHGAVIRTDVDVRSIDVRAGRVGGVTLSTGESIAAECVIANADASALATGRFGADAAQAVADARAALAPDRRSLSAMTWAVVTPTSGFDLSHHNVFFGADYAAEFDALFTRSQFPRDPTVYVCAQDRGDAGLSGNGPERLLCLVNAPAVGERRAVPHEEIDACERHAFERLARCGLRLTRPPHATVRTTPHDFETLFPATGGALYGAATHGWRSSFTRPGAKTSLPGLWLAGGSTHPGAGIPMAALSGRMAAHAILSARDSISRSTTTAMPGGTSTR